MGYWSIVFGLIVRYILMGVYSVVDAVSEVQSNESL